MSDQSWPTTPQDAPPGGWPAPTPPPAPVLRDHPRGTLAFVLGLLSIVGMPFFGPVGWYLGRRTLQEIDAQPDAYANRPIALAGMVLGIVGTVMLALLVLLGIVGTAALIVFAST